MPRGDRTGPEGTGSMTGRGLGYCAGYNEPGYTAGRGRGFGRSRCYGGGFGRGRGYGRYWGYDAGYDRSSEPEVSEKTLLENDIRILKDQLSSLEKRLEESSREK
ncbi:MAG TPA: DUF5320 domain-containing protein [Clostridiales bacterium]|nr:DUF5320 domain-containing protein [Clostridiales bacterium]HQP69125.1 DUF5320 domain-containing protein [Clostridiales bacterium]